jgi:muramoyltetrapeptide carboxypeptidase
MLKPRALEPGSRLAVLAPASSFPREEFESGIVELERLGFSPVYDDTVFARLPYTAGPAALRADAIHKALVDPAIAAIITVRGGFGSAHLLPLLDRSEIRRARKPFIGYSDITSLLAFVSTGCELVAFHGPTVAGRLGKGSGAYDRESFMNALCRREPMGELTTAGVETIKSGEITGPLFGGTLAQLVASLGTPFAFSPPERHVLFLDEATASLDEPSEAHLYRLLQERLPKATVVSIGHRSTLAAFHRRRLALDRDGDRFRLHKAALQPTAE